MCGERGEGSRPGIGRQVPPWAPASSHPSALEGRPSPGRDPPRDGDPGPAVSCICKSREKDGEDKDVLRNS